MIFSVFILPMLAEFYAMVVMIIIIIFIVIIGLLNKNLYSPFSQYGHCLLAKAKMLLTFRNKYVRISFINLKERPEKCYILWRLEREKSSLNSSFNVFPSH